ncbi:cpn60 chaperonin family protein [Gregarina niphandrodes]|uniref:Cpn60 chaperonin family protein n=1 Tax=Gregarina niphandrodes TaxID=110365 RepID=A0A023BAC3_GRENI|nr:cpn60 chaperonin family protein [Gregarina niphandrodes]EZG78213.1 cpn60 chaperonin family protein [Gregarina niphandrodes]|eukprot:XP_011129402.1 cpn60 chaperonin family protein [Gregarina niphandrodes]
MLTNWRGSHRGFSVAADPKVVCRGQEARTQILEGCDVLADAVGATLGPRGRNVIIQQAYGGPKITKDGVTVARSIELADPLHELGASLLKQVAQSANNASGDGTTTATVLAREIYKRGCEAVAAGLKPMEVLKGMKLATDEVLDYLQENSRAVSSSEELFHVAKVSANGDEAIGRLIADSVSKVGREGVVTVSEGKTVDHAVQFTEGYELDRGYVSPYFVTDGKTGRCVMEDKPMVLLSEDKITSLKYIMPALEHCAQNNRELLLVADDYDTEVLTALILNRLRGGLKVCAVKAPSFGEYRKRILEDLAVMTSATVLSKERSKEIATVAELGCIEKAVVDKDKCLVMRGSEVNGHLEEHVQKIRNQLKESDVTEYEASKLKERLAKLTSGVAVIQVGGNSEVELAELKDRVEDALNATRAAMAEGVLPGGGSALLFAARSIAGLAGANREQDAGIDIVRKACEVPLRKIAQNAGFEGAVVAGDLLRESKLGEGFDAMTGQYVDMYKAGILDPTMVVVTALKDASSVARLMCTTEAAVYNRPAERAQPNVGLPGGNDF